jgi:uncharacterized membrane protein YbhN (UPF0104 family)
MNKNLRRLLDWFGSGLALAGIVFVAFRIKEYHSRISFSQITPADWVAFFGLALLYGLANLMPASAWRRLLAQFKVNATRWWAIRIYGVSQLAKYIPGNIFHLASRQATGMSAGVPAGIMLKATVWELGLFALSGALYGWLVLPLLLTGFPFSLSFCLWAGTTMLVAFLLHQITGPEVAVSFFLEVLFLAFTGVMFSALLVLIGGGPQIHVQTWLLIGGAYVIAWLAGFVTPGAPAGLGIREMVLLILLKGFVNEADLLMAVLSGRLITVTGDLLFFMFSFQIPGKFCTVENHKGSG